MKTIDFTPYSDLIGSSGKATILISSTSPGIQEIELIYHRPWRSDEKPKRKLVITSSVLPESIDLSHAVESKATSTPEISTPNESAGAPLSPTILPADFDWRNVGGINYVTPARDQGFCGSCWSYAITGVMESALLINGSNFDPDTLNLSEQYLISCNRSYFDCGGGNATATDYLKDKTGQMYNPPGAALESDFPESPYKDNYPSTNLGCGLSAYRHPYRLSNWDYVYTGENPYFWRPYDPDPATFAQNRDLIKAAILNHGPVGAGMWSGFSFGNYISGIFEETPGSSTANHDVLIVGWHDNGNPSESYWTIKNSSGEDWGMNGFAWIAFDSPVIGFGAYYIDIPENTYFGNQLNHVYIPVTMKSGSSPTGHWEQVFSDNFEREDLGTGWDANNGGAYDSDPSTYSPYYWGVSQCRATTPGGHSLWVVGDGGTTPMLCGSAYDSTGIMNSSATYGPINLTGATSAYMRFKLWMNTQRYGVWQLLYEGDPGPFDDYYGYGYDGLGYSATPFSEWLSFPYSPGTVMGDTYGWKEMVLNLADLDGSHFDDANLLNRDNIYIYFGFSSDKMEIGSYLEGIYIDDVLIKKCVGGTCPLDW